MVVYEFTRNLSLCLHPCVDVATVVVSEMKERTGRVGETCCYRSEGNNSADACAYGKRYETGGNKQSCHNHTVRHKAQSQIDRCFYTPCIFGRVGESTSKNKYAEHHHNIFLSCTNTERFNSVFDRPPSESHYGINTGQHECHRYRHHVEITCYY